MSIIYGSMVGGGGSGGSGEAGGYYAPAVDAAGNLSWTASKADMPAVDGANIKGPQGKSAYQYAVEGGYTKTEAEFAEKLASEAIIVTITDNNGTLSADKTFTEIRDAILAGTTVIAGYDGTDLPLIALRADLLLFGIILCDETSVATVIIEITENSEVNDISSQVDSMPNPNPLVFIGAVTGAYDGTSTMTVKIPREVTDDHINSLIDTKLGVIENGAY